MIHITTSQETYYVDDCNRISRPSTGLGPSGDWLLLGAAEYRFGRVVRRYSVDEIRAGRVPWFYKNGAQRCFVRDRDHGTMREWQSPRLLQVTVTK